MKPIQTVQGLCLMMAIFAGSLQVWCLVEIPLTMFNHSVDDQYIGCSFPRESKLRKSGKIPLEEKYSKTWEKARSHWDGLDQTAGSFDPIYGMAIVAYTIGDHLYSDFNIAARNAGKSQNSYDHYAFRDFHLLLTKALQAKTDSKCHEVFRGIKNIRFTISDKVIRFGQFASSSLDENVAKGFGQDTFFSIWTCYGVPIHDFSYHKHQKEVLIPPYETFTVTDHRRSPNGVYIRLESRGVFSRCNCDVLNGKRLEEGRFRGLQGTSWPAVGFNWCNNQSAASLFPPLGMPFLLWGLLLTWSTFGSLGSL